MPLGVLSDIDLNKNQTIEQVIEKLSSAPGSPVSGQVYYNTTDNKFYGYNGSSWVDLGASGGSSPLTTKGDVHTYSTVDARLAVGTNGKVLTADSAETTGLKWADVGGLSLYSPTLANCANTTSETDVISFTIPASTWADGELVRLVVPVIKHKQNQGGAVNFTLKTYVAGTSKTIVNTASIANNASEGRTSFEIFFVRVGTSVYMIQGLDNSGSLNYQANAPMSARYFNSGTDFSSDLFTASANNEFTSVTFTSDVVVKMSVQFGTAHANTYYNVQSAKAFKIGGTTLASGTLGATAGGTGLTSYTVGDLLYCSATNVLSKLAIGSAGRALKVSGGLPAWADIAAGSTSYLQYNSSGALAADIGLQYDGSRQLTIGQAGVNGGRLRLEGNGSGYVRIDPSSAAGSWVLTLPPNDGNTGGYLVTDGAGVTAWVDPNLIELISATPTGTSNTTGLMQGLGLSITTGARTSGVIQVIASGSITSNTAANGWKYQIRYGTGTAPTNGAALTGTAVGRLTTGSLGTGATRATMPFCIVAKISGLAASTTYWIDLSLGAVTGGTTTMTDVCVNAEEK